MRPHPAVLIAAGLAAAFFLAKSLLPVASPTTGALPRLSTVALFAARFPDAEGHLQPIHAWRGQVLVVNFWATWCPPCREEMPELSALQDRYRGQGLVVLGISTDEVAKMQQFARANPVHYPLLAGDFEAMNLASSLGNGQGALPYTVVLGRDGSIANAYLGRLDVRALESTLPPLLGTPP